MIKTTAPVFDERYTGVNYYNSPQELFAHPGTTNVVIAEHMNDLDDIPAGSLDLYCFAISQLAESFQGQSDVVFRIKATPINSHGIQVEEYEPRIIPLLCPRDDSLKQFMKRLFYNLQTEYEGILTDELKGDLKIRQLIIAGCFVFRIGDTDYFQPGFDLDFPVSVRDPREEGERIAQKMKELGVKGEVIFSGSSYQIILDALLPYTAQNFGGVMGTVIQTYCDTSLEMGKLAYEIGGQIKDAKDWGELDIIAQRILDDIKSIGESATHEGMGVDLRWLAHQILQRSLFLRLNTAKGQNAPPRTIFLVNGGTTTT